MNWFFLHRSPSALWDCGSFLGLRIAARVVLGSVAVLVIASFVVPWQQTASGSGRVIAYAAVERQHEVEAPIEGRIVRWFVHEGDVVEEGAPLAEIADNDPDRLERLERVQQAVKGQIEALDVSVRTSENRIGSLVTAARSERSGANADVRVAEEKLRSSRQAEIAARASEDMASRNALRTRELHSRGIKSDRDLELATLDHERARAGLNQARAAVSAQESELQAARADAQKISAQNQALIEASQIALEGVKATRSKADAELANADSVFARQSNLVIRSPRKGTVLRIIGRQGGEMIKPGEPVLTLVPDSASTAAEVWVGGNDVPLIHAGRKVRLQFEGWPAVQFVGWPSVAVGTFGGQVAFVDSAANERGQFRVVVVPDPADQPWPEPRFLRQGARVRSWVMLDRVSIAFELWRQANGFPPASSAPGKEPSK